MGGVQAVLGAADDTHMEKSKTPRQTEINTIIETAKGLWHYGIPNKCLRHLPGRPPLHYTRLFNTCLWLSHLPKSWKDAKYITLLKTRQGPQISYIFTSDKPHVQYRQTFR